MALEYQVQQGIAGAARDDVLIAPQAPLHTYGPELHANVAVLRLLQGAWGSAAQAPGTREHTERFEHGEAAYPSQTWHGAFLARARLFAHGLMHCPGRHGATGLGDTWCPSCSSVGSPHVVPLAQPLPRTA
eukprot:365043-Chlamydomonas_euryale.AAC.26